MAEMLLHISTPEKLFFSQNVESVVITSIDGEVGVLPEHLPMVIALDSGPIKMRVKGDWKVAALSGGFAQIKNNEVVVLADTAEWPEEIEYNRALEAKKRAEERMQAHLSEVEYLRSNVALKRALTRLNLAKK